MTDFVERDDSNDAQVIEKLRKSFLDGYGFDQMVELIQASSGYLSVILVVYYFVRAFDLSIKDCMDIVSSSKFGGGSLSGEDMDSIIKPKIESNRYKWL